MLFTADSGVGGAHDLYFTSMTGAIATTTRVVHAIAPSTSGVTLFGAQTFVTDTRAIFALDDVVANQSRLFTVDLGAAPGTFAPVLVPGSGAFPAGSSGLTSTGVKSLTSTTADGLDIVFASDQGAAAGHLQLYSSPLVAPTPTVLGAAGLDVGTAALVGQTVFFTQLAATSAKPLTVWTNTIGHTGETEVSGTEITGMSSAVKLEAFSRTRALYFSQTNTGIANLWLTDVGSAPVMLAGPSAAGSPAISYKSNED